MEKVRNVHAIVIRQCHIQQNAGVNLALYSLYNQCYGSAYIVQKHV